jgi:hypothetical protein
MPCRDGGSIEQSPLFSVAEPGSAARSPSRSRARHRDASRCIRAQLRRQFDTLYREGETVPRVRAIAVHPFVTGQPHRIGVLDASGTFLERLLAVALEHQLRAIRVRACGYFKYRAAMTGLLNAAKEVREHGTFGYIDTSLAVVSKNVVQEIRQGSLVG